MGKAYGDWGVRVCLPSAGAGRAASHVNAVLGRRSVRDFRAGSLSLEELALLLHAAQGVTHPRGYRAAPSAGALYPLELHAAVGVDGPLPSGAYRFIPGAHELHPRVEGDLRKALAAACLGQNWMAEAPCCIVAAAVYERVTRKYADRGVRYVHMEAGCAAQGVALMAAALGLGAVCVGAFRDSEIQRILHLDESERPLLAIPVGRA